MAKVARRKSKGRIARAMSRALIAHKALCVETRQCYSVAGTRFFSLANFIGKHRVPCTVALQQLNACDLAHARQNVSALALAHRRSAQVNQVRPFVGTQLRRRREDMHAAERVRYHSHLRCLDRPRPCRARPTRSIQRCASELKANRKGDGCQRKRVRRPSQSCSGTCLRMRIACTHRPERRAQVC